MKPLCASVDISVTPQTLPWLSKAKLSTFAKPSPGSAPLLHLSKSLPAEGRTRAIGAVFDNFEEFPRLSGVDGTATWKPQRFENRDIHHSRRTISVRDEDLGFWMDFQVFGTSGRSSGQIAAKKASTSTAPWLV